LHPEVNNISFLTLLYAGITFILSFKYLVLIDKVKILKQWSKSAGNKFKFGTSETLRNGTIINLKNNIKPISIHVPKYLRPINDEEFGYYLAGLIDGSGSFSKTQELIIMFHIKNISLAYYIKKKIGYGTVKKDKNTLLFTVGKKGIEKVITLINDKIRTINMYNEIKKFMFYNNLSSEIINLNINSNKNFENHWLAGFTDAIGNFQIDFSIEKFENILNYQIDHKENSLLHLISEFLGGNIKYLKSQDIYNYNSTFFGSAKNVINYFSKYQLLSTKHVNYIKWRKAYILIQNKDYLTISGLKKINKLKNSMIRYEN
jgi:LAGLIDADG endonuclease